MGALLIPGLFSLLVFRGVLFLGELPFRRDMSLQFIPLKRMFSEALRAGTLPQWWPWDALGSPLLALPMLSAFHPSSLFFVALPFHAAFVLQYLLPVPLALTGTWLLGRALGLRPVFAALAATGYVLGGYFLDVTEFTYISLAAGALPWLWWGAWRCRSPVRPRPWVFALALASMLLAGDPLLSLMGLLGAGVWVVRRVPPRRQWRPALAFVFGTGLALALSAVQSLPSLLLLRESARARGLADEVAFDWQLDLPQLLGMVAPQVHASPPLLEMTYVGLSVAALAGVGVLVRGRARGRLVFLTVVSVLLAFGSATPLWEAFSAVVPVWKSIRYPIKALGPATLLLPLLAARGAQQVCRSGRRRFLPALGCALGAVVGLVMGAWMPLLPCLLLALVWGVMAWRPRLVPVLSFVALAVVALDLSLTNGHVVATLPPAFYAPPALVKPLRDGGVSLEGACYSALWSQPARFQDTESSTLARNAALFPARGSLHGLPACTPYLPGYSARVRALWGNDGENWAKRLAGIYGSRFIIVHPSFLRPEQRPRVVAYDDFSEAAVLSQQRYLPRAYTVQGVKVLPRAQVLDYLMSDFRPGQEVVLEAEAVGALGDRPPVGPARPVDALRREGDAVEIETTLEAPGLLVLNESYFEGVRVTEDGRPLPLYPANHAVRAVPLEAGRHRVRFEYHTPGLVAGAAVSLSALALLAVVALLQTRRRAAR
ncbi:MAG: YfhO family protein [Cystobacter sp.]